MRKLILEEWLTLDGYAADANGKLDFLPAAEKNKYSDTDQLQFLESVDTILLGRITYGLFAGYWPSATVADEIIAGKINSIPKIICSNSLQKAPWGKWPEAQILREDAVDGIKKLKEKEGKNIVLWGSVSLAQSLMNAGLIDAFHFNICPITFGTGRSLFPDADKRSSFKLVNFRTSGAGVMHLQYEPRR